MGDLPRLMDSWLLVFLRIDPWSVPTEGHVHAIMTHPFSTDREVGGMLTFRFHQTSDFTTLLSFIIQEINIDVLDHTHIGLS